MNGNLYRTMDLDAGALGYLHGRLNGQGNRPVYYDEYQITVYDKMFGKGQELHGKDNAMVPFNYVWPIDFEDRLDCFALGYYDAIQLGGESKLVNEIKHIDLRNMYNQGFDSGWTDVNRGPVTINCGVVTYVAFR